MWNRATDTEESFRDRAIALSAAIVMAGAIGIGVYYRYYSQPQEPVNTPEIRPPPAPKANTEPAIQHPLPQSAPSAVETALPYGIAYDFSPASFDFVVAIVKYFAEPLGEQAAD